jgi:hypothetical protein
MLYQLSYASPDGPALIADGTLLRQHFEEYSIEIITQNRRRQ